MAEVSFCFKHYCSFMFYIFFFFLENEVFQLFKKISLLKEITPELSSMRQLHLLLMAPVCWDLVAQQRWLCASLSGAQAGCRLRAGVSWAPAQPCRLRLATARTSTLHHCSSSSLVFPTWASPQDGGGFPGLGERKKGRRGREGGGWRLCLDAM